MDDFADFMTDTITVEPLVSKDDYGLETYGPAVSYACRIDAGTKQTVSVGGVDRSVDAMIYLTGVPGIGPMDRLTLSGFIPAQPTVLRVSPFTDEVGPHHTEIALGGGAQRIY